MVLGERPDDRHPSMLRTTHCRPEGSVHDAVDPDQRSVIFNNSPEFQNKRTPDPLCYEFRFDNRLFSENNGSHVRNIYESPYFSSNKVRCVR